MNPNSKSIVVLQYGVAIDRRAVMAGRKPNAIRRHS